LKKIADDGYFDVYYFKDMETTTLEGARIPPEASEPFDGRKNERPYFHRLLL
jgi:hypothetical protein